MKKTFKRILDILMTLALPCLMAYELIGQETHEILGLCMVGLLDRKSTRLNSSHPTTSRMPSSA